MAAKTNGNLLLTTDQCARAPLTQGKAIAKLQDGGGLHLMIDAKAKSWRLRYRLNGKDALMSLGVFPAVSLENARARAQAARSLIAKGQSPALERAHQRATEERMGKTFATIAEEYNGTQAHMSPKTRERIARNFKYSAKLWGKTLDQIDRPMLLAACRALQNVGKTDSVHRLGIYFSQVYRYARDNGYYKGDDPTQGGFGKSLNPVRETHRPALTDPAGVKSLMLNIDTLQFEGTVCGPTVAHALQLLARTAVRPGELGQAQWCEFDLDGARHAGAATWVIPVARMKMKDAGRADHVVPLSTQAVEIVRAQHALTGHLRHVFPNARDDSRPMTDAALPAAMVALGYKGKHVPHGFRTMFKTLSQDVLKAESELVERQLAHRVGNDVASAYDRSQRLDERRKLMQAYSDLLDEVRDRDAV